MTNGCLSAKAASRLAAVCNILGTACGFLSGKLIFSGSVTDSVTGLVSFADTHAASVAVTSALIAVALWALAAWRLGIPTSESHGIAAGLAGAAHVIGGRPGVSEWIKLGIGLFLSVILGYLLGIAVSSLLRRMKRPEKEMKTVQIVSAAAASFMHGAQDGQKFIGLWLLLGVSGGSILPCIVCGLIMAFGTRFGGKRIIENIGSRMVRPDMNAGAASDIASALSLSICTVAGLPVSTTHTKTCAMMGAGRNGINMKAVREIALAWLLTFPVPAALGAVIALVLLYL